MSILLDRKSLQVASHCGDFHPSVLGKRLEIFLGILEGIDGEIPDQDNSLLYEVIFKHDLLVIPTRISPFEREELTAIERFVKNGGSLLLMSNHTPFKEGLPDFTEHDKQFTERVNVHLEGPVFPDHHGRDGLTTIEGDDLCHDITRNLEKGIVFNNSCQIRSDNERAQILARLPGIPEENQCFALAIEHQSGRIVFTADSGFIGNEDTNTPGPGLIDHGGNRLFVEGVVKWLLHKT